MPHPIQHRTSAAVPRAHLAYLDGLRAAAALFVAYHHTWIESGLPVYQFGHYAVGLFIVISGFSLSLPVLRAGGVLAEGALSFFRRRAWRILPPYYAALAISLGLVWLFLGKQIPGYWDNDYVIEPRGVATHLILVHQLFPSTASQINGPFWSIGVEWWIYFLFPSLVVLFRRWGALLTVAAVTAGSLAVSLVLLHTPLNMGNHGVSPQYVALFAFGMLSAQIVRSDQPHFAALRGRVPWAALAALLLAPLVLLARPWSHNPAPAYLSDYMVGLWSVALLVAASRPGGRLNRAFAWRPLSFVGGFAYSIYLLHVPLLHLAWQYLLYPLGLSRLGNLALLGLVGVPLIVGLCYLFYLAVERPFISSSRSRRAATQIAATAS